MNLIKFWREQVAKQTRRRNLQSHGPVTKRFCPICGTHIADLEKKPCLLDQQKLRHLR